MRISLGGCRLGDWLEKFDLSQAAYARMTNRAPRMISHFCANERVMQPDDIHVAMLIFNLKSVNQLYDIVVELDDSDPDWLARRLLRK